MYKFLKECDTYYHYENNNRYSKEHCTREQADVAVKTLIDCENCYDCKACENCYNCKACYDCRNCRHCCMCHYCKNCRHLYLASKSENKGD